MYSYNGFGGKIWKISKLKKNINFIVFHIVYAYTVPKNELSVTIYSPSCHCPTLACFYFDEVKI